MRSLAPRIAAIVCHLEAVRSLLAKAGLDESYLACGAHWPISEEATRELLRAGQRPRAIHNNCSGKHAGMLATASISGFDPRGYERPDHPRADDDRANHFRDLRNRVGPSSHGDRRLLGADLRPAAARPWREASRGSAAARGFRSSAARPHGDCFMPASPSRSMSRARGASTRSCSGRCAPSMLHQGRRRRRALRGVAGARARHRAEDRRRREACGGASHERDDRGVLPEANALADQLGGEMHELEGHRCRPRRSERGAAARSCAAHDAFNSFLICFEALARDVGIDREVGIGGGGSCREVGAGRRRTVHGPDGAVLGARDQIVRDERLACPASSLNSPPLRISPISQSLTRPDTLRSITPSSALPTIRQSETVRPLRFRR